MAFANNTEVKRIESILCTCGHEHRQHGGPKDAHKPEQCFQCSCDRFKTIQAEFFNSPFVTKETKLQFANRIVEGEEKAIELIVKSVDYDGLQASEMIDEAYRFAGKDHTV